MSTETLTSSNPKNKLSKKRKPTKYSKTFKPTSTQGRPWPLLGYVALLALAVAWLFKVPHSAKLMAIIGATGFACIEFIFRSITIEHPDGRVELIFSWKWLTDRKERKKKPLSKGHSTPQQFWANIFALPVFLYGYYHVPLHSYVRVALFPFNIWLLEIIEGYFITYLYGKNVAWYYSGSDAFFHGNIKLGYWKYWLCLGTLLEVLFPQYVLPVCYQLGALF